MLWLEGRAREGVQGDHQRPWWRRGSEGRRIMQDRIEQNALELLHAIREHHPDIYAGAWVNPSTAALEAGLDPDSTQYTVAMEYLQAEDVLEEAEESRARRRPALHHHAPGHGDAARSV